MALSPFWKNVVYSLSNIFHLTGDMSCQLQLSNLYFVLIPTEICKYVNRINVRHLLLLLPTQTTNVFMGFDILGVKQNFDAKAARLQDNL